MSATHYGVDFHLHTRYSDGLDTPAQLVQKAAQQGLRSIAITDHDSVAGLPEAQQAGQHHNVEVLSGIELSVQYQEFNDIHILGYLFKPHHESLQSRLRHMQDRRVQRGFEILARVNTRLTRRGQAPLDRASILQHVHGALARPHLGRELMRQGYVHSMEEAFREFLIPCDVPKAHLDPAEAFDLIARAGGICSLAHPGLLSPDATRLEPLLDTFKGMGLVGVEVYHHCHYPDSIGFFLTRARRYGLIVTGGSDYHGRPHGAVLGHIAPGYAIPDHVLIELRQAWRRRVEGIALTSSKQLC
ncbi:3',5'-nucleoside bisphosphate phosphatase [Candidatus Entotheonellaceae bacterium PAL068K]